MKRRTRRGTNDEAPLKRYKHQEEVSPEPPIFSLNMDCWKAIARNLKPWYVRNTMSEDGVIEDEWGDCILGYFVRDGTWGKRLSKDKQDGRLAWLDVLALDSTCKRFHKPGLNLAYALLWYETFGNSPMEGVYKKPTKAMNLASRKTGLSVRHAFLPTFSECGFLLCPKCWKCPMFHRQAYVRSVGPEAEGITGYNRVTATICNSKSKIAKNRAHYVRENDASRGDAEPVEPVLVDEDPSSKDDRWPTLYLLSEMFAAAKRERTYYYLGDDELCRCTCYDTIFLVLKHCVFVSRVGKPNKRDWTTYKRPVLIANADDDKSAVTIGDCDSMNKEY
jgi:hypothetical protein